MDYKQALEKFKYLLQVREAALGKNHPESLFLNYQVASLTFKSGKRKEGFKQFLRNTGTKSISISYKFMKQNFFFLVSLILLFKNLNFLDKFYCNIQLKIC